MGGTGGAFYTTFTISSSDFWAECHGWLGELAILFLKHHKAVDVEVVQQGLEDAPLEDILEGFSDFFPPILLQCSSDCHSFIGH